MSAFLMKLVAPLGLTFVFLVLAAVVLLLKGRRKTALLPALLVLLLYVVGATPLPVRLLASLERPYAAVAVEGLPEADAVVMLGGLLTSSTNDLFGADYGPAVDRAIAAAELIRQDKAKDLVLGGGVKRDGPPGAVESDYLLPWLNAWKLTPRRVHQLRNCFNTHDEALAYKQLADERKWERVILVTSAFHMRRAEATFRAAGLDVICFPADFNGLAGLPNAEWSVLPGVGGLQTFDVWLHEVVGWWVYRWRGWIE
jgi:uncharacterized SAM-binding protein YcdF (DUF218 family)